MNNDRLKTCLITIIFLICVFPFIFVKTAVAQTSSYALSTPSVQSDSTGALGTLYISEASYPNSLKSGDTLSISLPTSVFLKTIQIQETAASSAAANVTITLDKVNRQFTVSGSVYNYGSFSGPITSGAKPTGQGGPRTFSVQVTDNNRFGIMINQGFIDGSTYYKFLIAFPSVYIKPSGPNDPTAMTATLDTPSSSGFSTGSYTLANVAVAGTTASVDAPLSSGVSQTYIVPVIGENGGSVAPIIIKETAPGSLTTSGTVKLALPPGFTWSNVNLIQDWGFSANDPAISGPDVTKQITTDDSGQSIISLTINHATTSSAGRITVNGSIDVDSSVAQPGDILVSYGGTNQGVSAATLTVGTYAANGVTASQETTTDVVAGRLDQQVGQFSVQEQAPGDLPKGRSVTFTLPDRAKWHTIPTVVRQAGDGAIAAGTLNSDKTVLKYAVTQTSTVRSYFVFKNGSVDLAVYNPDTLTVTVGGSGSITGTETIANIMQPIALTVDKKTVKPGTQGQSIGDITINEQSAGALRAKDTSGKQALLTLQLPPGVTFSQTPTLAVSTGNINLTTSQISIGSSNRVLTVPITQASSVPSTITLSGIKVDVDRTIPDGDLKMEIGGTAIGQTSDVFSDSLSKIGLVIASSGATASGNSGTVVFTIDQASYTVGGQSVSMDTAPYIKDGRTMIPLRFAANAVGVTDSNILWDGSANMVTLLKGTNVVQMQIGKNAMKINGVDITTDVAPEIRDGRTMLPIRALGTSLGASLQWDEVSQTVTISIS